MGKGRSSGGDRRAEAQAIPPVAVVLRALADAPPDASLEAVAGRLGMTLRAMEVLASEANAPTEHRIQHLPPGSAVETGETEAGRVAYRRRFRASPVERLAARGVLTGLQVAAANKLRRQWWESGLGRGLASPALGGVVGGGDGNPPYGMPQGEHQADQRRQFRVAIATLSERTRSVVGAIVLDEVEVDEVGRTTGRANRNEASAIVLDRLKEGLGILSRHYRLAC